MGHVLSRRTMGDDFVTRATYDALVEHLEEMEERFETMRTLQTALQSELDAVKDEMASKANKADDDDTMTSFLSDWMSVADGVLVCSHPSGTENVLVTAYFSNDKANITGYGPTTFPHQEVDIPRLEVQGHDKYYMMWRNGVYLAANAPRQTVSPSATTMSFSVASLTASHVKFRSANVPFTYVRILFLAPVGGNGGEGPSSS